MAAEIALVVDALAVLGGGERVILAALEMFPKMPIYTLVYTPSIFTHTSIAKHPVIPSLINRLPQAREHYRSYLPLMPYAVEHFDLQRYDLVLSFSYAVAHGVRLQPGQRHYSYTYTPMRYAWRNVPVGGVSTNGWLVERVMRAFRRWDRAAAARINKMAVISNFVAGLVRQAYQQEAQVIYPPVDVERFHPDGRREGYYMVVSRLVAHKRIDLVVEAFAQLKLPLVVVGEGPESANLQQFAPANITFTGCQPDSVVSELLNHARGFICASEEDFGIAVVEAQAAGCPVIAYCHGGVLETVIDGQTGLYYCEQSVPSLVDAIQRFELQANSFNPQDLVNNACRFSKERFKAEFSAFIASDGSSVG